jgi:hypothetical protein
MVAQIKGAPAKLILELSRDFLEKERDRVKQLELNTSQFQRVLYTVLWLWSVSREMKSL